MGSSCAAESFLVPISFCFPNVVRPRHFQEMRRIPFFSPLSLFAVVLVNYDSVGPWRPVKYKNSKFSLPPFDEKNTINTWSSSCSFCFSNQICSKPRDAEATDDDTKALECTKFRVSFWLKERKISSSWSTQRSHHLYYNVLPIPPL